MRPNYTARALMLRLRLNADRMDYTPRPHKGRRAARLVRALERTLKAVQS